MTGTISERSLAVFQIAGGDSIADIAKSRLPRLAFPRDYALHKHTVETAEYAFESVFVDNYAHAYSVIAGGEADGFVTMNTAEPTLTRYGDVVWETFFPLIFASASLSTQIRDLAPVISVVQKALESGVMSHLTELHAQGRYDYKRNEFSRRLTGEELDYIRSNNVIKISAETANYPISFYNENENEFQGIAFDILSELEIITGLSFEIADTRHRSFLSGAELLERGEVSMITELGSFKGNKGRFLWPETPIMKDYSVFISKSEFPDFYFNELGNVSVGIVRGTGHAALFKGWFPNNTNYMEYDNSDSAFNALERGEVEMLLARANYLLSLENYKEVAGYKANIIFDNYFNCYFGFNKDEAVLCAIVDKALSLIDLETISEHWTRKTFDYRAKVSQSQLPWFIGATALSLAVLALILVLFFRSRGEGKRLKKLVAEKNSTLSAIFNTTPDLIFCKDKHSHITECNKAYEIHFNGRRSDIAGKNDKEAFDEHYPDLVVQYMDIDKKVISEGQSFTIEEYIPSPDGTRVLFETIKTPLIQDGKITGLVGMSRDISRRKAAEEEAKNASIAKSRFIANMSHEMRAPMSLIVGLTELMMEEDDVPGKIKGMLEKTSTAGGTLLEIINGVLDISKIEAGKMELIQVKYDVAGLLNDVITLNTIRIGEKPVTFKLDVNENLPVSLFGDDLRVKQILNNLLSNAFKYTKEGTVILAVGCMREDDTVWVNFNLSDTGIGIRGEDIEKLFIDYNKVDIQSNRGIEGTGLGLSITKKFVELMGGEISVESEYGKGTTFKVRIRQGFVDDKTIGKETAENLYAFRYAGKQTQVKLIRPDLSYARVLLVDDFPANFDVAVEMLRKYKMQVDCVTSGREAVDRISAGEPVYNAVFMDHIMPEMDGIEATKLIRALGNNYAENIPIIALSANAVAGSERMFLDNGFNAFLPKPYNMTMLDSVVKQWITDKSKE
jgi:PAS domain S-box-containing protein